MDASGDCGGSGGGGGGYQPPTISHVLTCSNTGNNGWCIGALNLDLTASDPQGQTVVISGTVNGVAFACPSGQTTCSIPLPEAAGTATYKVDSATGLSASGSTSYQLDVTTPQIDGSINGSSGNSGWYTSQTSVSALASDALSGLASFEVNADNAGWASYSDTTFTDDMHTIQFRAIDNAGNVTETALQSVNVDTTAPTLNLATTGTMGQNSWYVSAVTLTPTASDATSGLYSLEVTTDGNTWSSVSAPLILTDGVYTVQFRATDNAGNISQTPSQQVKIDATTPSLSLNVSGTRGQNDWFISSTTVTPNASDAGSGINKTEAKIDNGTWSIVNSSASFVDGVHTYQYKVTDNAGNVTETPSITMMVDTVPPAIAMSDDTLALGDTLMYDLEDSLSGLWITRAVIEDEGEKYKKLVWVEEITGKKSNNNAIRWDGVFADGTKAAPGQYFITLKVSDQAGNETMRTAIVEVTAFNSILPIPVFTPPTSLTPNPSPSERGEPVLEFGGANNGTVGTETAVTNGETVFASVSLQAGGTSSFTAGNQSSNVPNTNSNILWGAAAATMLGATLAEWQRRREEEEAARRAAMFSGGGGDDEEEASDVSAKKRAKVMAKNQAKRAQEQAWENARTAQNQKKEEAIEAAWNQSRRAQSLESMSARIHANAVQQAQELHRQGERESVVQGKQEQGKNIFQKITSAVTPFLQDASQQLNDLNANITKPSNSTGPLFGSEKYNNGMSAIQGLGVLIDQGLFNGKIQQTANNLKQNLETNPTYNTVTNIIEFGTGAAFQYLNDNSFGLFEKVMHVNWENGGDAFQSGRQLGRTASNIQGAVEFVTGAAAAAFFLSSIPPTGGLTAVCAGATGGSCLFLGAIAIPVELALAGASAAVSAHGAATLANNANNPLQIKGSDRGANDQTLSYGTNSGYGKGGDNADKLRKNLEALLTEDEIELIRNQKLQPHHIVPSTNQDPSAQAARKLLWEEFHIDINQAENGVFIDGIVNKKLNNPRYMEAVYRALQNADDSAEAISVLQSIADQILLTGTYP